MAESILEIEGVPAPHWELLPDFDKLTPLFPNRRIFLEAAQDPSISARAVDLIAPLGMGQRGLIVAPPRAGKTLILKALATAIRVNHPDIVLMLLLVDERPEEVTDLRRDLDCEIYSSTFDEQVIRHVQVCEAVAERAKRLVELKKDVILLDSITRMSRGYNNPQPNKRRIISGGVDSKALARPRKSSAPPATWRKAAASPFSPPPSWSAKRTDDLIFEEFKGTGNMEVHLDRSIAEQRIYPAIHIVNSGTDAKSSFTTLRSMSVSLSRLPRKVGRRYAHTPQGGKGALRVWCPTLRCEWLGKCVAQQLNGPGGPPCCRCP